MFPRRHRYANANTRPVIFLLAALMLAALSAAVFAPSARQASAQTARAIPLSSVVASITGLNLRDQPTATGKVIAAMPANGRAIVLGGPFNDNWYWLDYNGTAGYASGRYLVIADSNYTPVPTGTPGEETATTTPSPATGTPSPATTPEGTPTIDISVPGVAGDYTNLWLGELTNGGNVRVGPGLDKPVMKSWWPGRRVLLYGSATDSKGGVWYRVSEPPEAPMWVHSSLIRKVAPVQFQPARFKGRWVDVNLDQQITTAYENGKPVKVTLCSTGKGKNETNVGTWKIYWRLPKQDMEGGNLASGDYYKLKDVPYPQYFNMTGESLHGTYWHDDFGRVHSHGCVNLSIPMSEWFYKWANIGTIVYVHN